MVSGGFRHEEEHRDLGKEAGATGRVEDEAVGARVPQLLRHPVAEPAVPVGAPGAITTKPLSCWRSRRYRDSRDGFARAVSSNVGREASNFRLPALHQYGEPQPHDTAEFATDHRRARWLRRCLPAAGRRPTCPRRCAPWRRSGNVTEALLVRPVRLHQRRPDVLRGVVHPDCSRRDQAASRSSPATRSPIRDARQVPAAPRPSPVRPVPGQSVPASSARSP